MTTETHPIEHVLAHARQFADDLTLGGADRDEEATLSMLVNSIRSWAPRHIDDYRIDKEAHIPPVVLESARQMGLFGLSIPQSHGGAGLSMKGCCRVIDELATFSSSVAVTIGLHCGLGIRGLVQYGTETLKQRYLSRLASGELMAAFAATEPNAGSDIASVATIGRWDGERRVVLEGSKIYVTNGGLADTFTVIARTPGLGGVKRGHSLFLLTRDMPGLKVGREEVKLGIKGSSTTTLDLDGVQVDLEHLIGEPARGMELMNQVLAWGRTLMAAGCLGAARRAFRLATQYATVRQQFGRPIGQFGQIAHQIAAMRATLYAMESLQRQVNQVLDRYQRDITWESSILKVFNSEGACRLADDAIQIHGGSGYIEETGVARILRDVRITRIFEGANEVLRFHLASQALGFKASSTPAPPLQDRVAPEIQPEGSRFDRLHSEAIACIQAVLKRFGFRVFQHQLVLKGIADALIGLYAYLAVLLRTDGEVRTRGAEAASQEIRLARLAGHLLGRQVEEGLAVTRRDEEETLVEAISGWEYDRL